MRTPLDVAKKQESRIPSAPICTRRPLCGCAAGSARRTRRQTPCCRRVSAATPLRVRPPGWKTVTRPTLPRMLSSPCADTFHRLSHASCHFLVYTCAEGLGEPGQRERFELPQVSEFEIG